MIKPTRGYTSSDGIMHATLEQAQKQEIYLLVKEAGDIDAGLFSESVIEHADRIVDILTTGTRSRPTRRKVNGAPPLKRSARPVKDARLSKGPTLDEDGDPVGSIIQGGPTKGAS